MMNYKQSSLKPRFVKQNKTSNPFETSPKSQNIEPTSMPEIHRLNSGPNLEKLNNKPSQVPPLPKSKQNFPFLLNI